MSYRTFKRVLGETSLERKCRLLFGASLLLLISGSFYWYGNATKRLLYDTTRSNCRYLVDTVFLKTHFKFYETDPQRRELVQEMIADLENLAYDWKYLALEPVDNEDVYQCDDWEREHLTELRAAYLQQLEEVEQQRLRVENGGEDEMGPDEAAMPSEPVYETFKGIVPKYVDRRLSRAGQYHYYQPVYWRESCLSCHRTVHADYLGEAKADESSKDLVRRLPFRVVKVVLPHRPTQTRINRNNSILIAMAIVTVFLSMVALYIVVRYVIVKPLQHLQLVSEEVEHGNYEARAQIETNDEFEQLAQSFNRMVRHLVDTQKKLQDANIELDAKVDQLAQLNMQLYEMNRLKSEFLANVSHELRTPLNSIIGFSDVLQSIDALNGKQKRYVTNIGQSGRVLLDMINDILDLAKMESGKMNVRCTEFSVSAVVQAQCQVVRGLAAEKNIDLYVHCPDNLPEMYQDQHKVQQILTNLLSNAIKFTPEGGRLTVTASAEPPDFVEIPARLALTVEDTGVGIAEEDREIIFEKFRQATVTTGGDNLSREFSGTGLGLSIVKELCKLLGGEVTFTSRLGQGSAFTVHLPWVLATAPTAVDEIAAEEERRDGARPADEDQVAAASKNTAATEGGALTTPSLTSTTAAAEAKDHA